jgi:hypothetical protein
MFGSLVCINSFPRSIASERQIRDNCIFDGENSLIGFGQMAALLLALAPLWSLATALYKYPGLLRRKNRRIRRQMEEDRRRATEVEMDNMQHTDEVVGGAITRIASEASGEGLQPPTVVRHSRSDSNTSINDTVPLIEDIIPRQNLRLRGPWDPRYDSEEDSD